MLLPLELQGEDKTGAWTGQCQLGSLRAELLEAPPTMDWAPFYLLPLVFSTGQSILGSQGSHSPIVSFQAQSQGASVQSGLIRHHPYVLSLQVSVLSLC